MTTSPGCRSYPLERVVGILPRVDVLVNNAGANLPGGRSEYEPDVYEESVRINLFGAFRVATACHGALAKSEIGGGASVINLASMAAYFGIAIVPGYGAAKAGVVQMTKALAVAWAADGIRVNAVAPGLIHSRAAERYRINDNFPRLSLLQPTALRRVNG
jgi:3-oxoacyl-[acyl-carrier protein] reductase